MEMTYNYHTHTTLCGHATGTKEEYIQRAIKCNMTHMGFSDHAPFIFPDGHESHYRVPVAKAGEYVEDISRLREKYKDKIDIRIGFEMEYYPTHFENMLKTARDAGAEYLILGHHFLREEAPDGAHTIKENYCVEDLREYVSCVVSAIESGVFTYVAHPDIMNFRGDSTIYNEEMRKICVASKEKNIPLEINFLGIRDERTYPNEAFWRIAGEEGCPVTFGFDAHTAYSAYDGESLVKAEQLVKDHNLNYIGKPDIIFINR